MYRPALIIIIALLLATSGCLSPQQPPVTASISKTVTPPPITVATPVPVTPSQSTTVATTIPTTRITTTPTPTPTAISDEALNARIVDARNKLTNLIDSNVADTIVFQPADAPGCDVKKSKELGYLIDVTTGESTFIKGDYGSINAGNFQGIMNKEHEYVIIHTHPRMWATCRGSGIVSLYTFSIADLEATASLTEKGYRVRYLIAISDKEYRIWPKRSGEWKSPDEIRDAIWKIEQRLETPFAFHDTLLDTDYYEVDSLMPLLAKELNYSYSANNDVIA